MKKLENTEWVPLHQYVENLLREGKRSKHPDFKTLISIYGEEKITEMAKDILKKWKEKKT